ncbi:phage tail protein [Flavivirga jejuensis]|uniref:Tail fiber protein n=1 Tax=Flavivirga jejuensis TaxID=870487 RepID=A0ABT8WNE5_9FLAO|nr:tail fiber protein [Flavivirga jejuensis]MDO5974670.1 tail fiber protein [Flavivirga jejuensis]
MKKTIKVLTLFLCLCFANTINAQEAYLGDIKLTAISFNQRGWVSCEGQLLAISQNTALFSLLGTTYGGDGRTTFGLPDLRGRVPMGVGSGPGLPSYREGQKGGSTTNTLTVANLPAHNHTVNAVLEDGNQSVPTSNLPAGTKLLDKEYSDASAANTTMNSGMINNTGGSQAVNNMQPYTVVRYVICTSGLFPSRN